MFIEIVGYSLIILIYSFILLKFRDNIINFSINSMGVLLNYVQKLFCSYKQTKLSEISINNNKKAWYHINRIRAHALGGIIGKKYTNSLEALTASYSAGLRVVEADISLTKDGFLVLSHFFLKSLEQGFKSIPTYNEFMKTKIHSQFTPMSFDDLLNFMIEHSDLYVVIDCKKKYKEIVTKICNNNSFNILLDRFIIQVSSIQEFKFLKQKNEYVNIEFSFPLFVNIWKKIDFLLNNHIHTISIHISRIDKELVDLLNILGIKIFVRDINCLSETNKILESGCWGITSSFLNEKFWI